MDGAEFGISDDRLEAIAAAVRALPEEVEKAIKKTVSETSKFASTLAKTVVGQALALDAEAARRRILAFNRTRKVAEGRRAQARIFFGLNPLDPVKDFSPGLVSNARGRSTEMTTGRGFPLPEGSFLGTHQGGGVAVFVRKGPARLPLKRVRLLLDQQGTEAIERGVWPQVTAFFYARFELNLQAVMAKDP